MRMKPFAPVEQNTASFLKSLPEYLRERATPVYVKSGQTLHYKNETVSYAYVVLSGELWVMNELADGHAYTWITLRPCGFVSELEILSRTMVYPGEIVANQDSILLRCNCEDFNHCLDTDIKFLRMVTFELASKSYQLSYSHGHSAYKSNSEKMLLHLLKVCQFSPPCAQRPVIIRKTRQELACEVGVSVKTVNRSISKLKEDGFVSIRSGKVTVNEGQYERMQETWQALSS